MDPLIGPFTVVFIANTGRGDQPLPDYLLEALNRFQEERAKPRYCLVAHDVQIFPGMAARSQTLKLSGEGDSVQFAVLNMLGEFNPGPY